MYHNEAFKKIFSLTILFLLTITTTKCNLSQVIDVNKPIKSPAPNLKSRIDLLKQMPKNGIVIEIGVQKENFAALILEHTNTKHLYLIDCLEHQGNDIYPWAPANVSNKEQEKLSNVVNQFKNDKRVTIIRDSYKSALINFIEKHDKPIFDYILLNSTHTSETDEIVLLLVDKLLKPDGYLDFSNRKCTQKISSMGRQNEPSRTQAIKNTIDLLTTRDYHYVEIVKNKIYQKKWTTSPWSISKELFDFIKKILPPASKMLELGSGWASEQFSKFYTVYSIEHDKRWLNKYKTNYIYAPIVNDWYNPNILAQKLPQEYNLILVDGPTGTIGRGKFYDYLHLFKTNLIIIFDDIDRPAEYNLMRKVANKLGKNFTIYTDSFGKQFGVVDNR